MYKVVCTVVLLAMAIACAKAGGKVCEVMNGKKMITFSGTPELIKFPCKYNAIRDTVCGNWKVTVSPGNMLETYRSKLYVIRTVYVGVERISDGLKWEGRTDLKIAKKYLTGFTDAPFNTKDGALAIDDVFEFGSPNADMEVSLKEKSGAFDITFNLFDPMGRWHKDSAVSFKCKSNNFVPTEYPTQLCGNGTDREVKTFKKSMEWREHRQATLFYNIFTNLELIQTDNNCIAAQRAMSKRCIQNGEDLRYKAANLCWPIVGKPTYQRCISGNMDSPISAFRHCVEFVCSGYTDPNSCAALGDELDLCPAVPEVSDTVKSVCRPDLVTA